MEANFKKIIAKHNRMLYKIARSYTAEEVDFEELYQEMLIQIWQSYPSYSAASKLSTWIYRVALNTAISFVRKQKRSVDFHEIQEQLPASVLEPVMVKEQKIEMLYSCIYQLAKDDRAIILLYLEGNPYEEIAEIIGLKANHIGVKILRIKKKLHQLLIKKGYGKI